MRIALGVIVAGGRGARLGSGPKALVLLEGRTLLDRAIETVSQCCEEWIVAAAPDIELPVEGARLVRDAPWSGGPLAGVAAALEAREPSDALVLGVDFPLARPQALAALAARRGNAPAVLPAPGGSPQPLAAVYGAAACAALKRAFAEGETSIRRAALALDPLILDDIALAALEGDSENFFNVNTPEDLAGAARMLAARTGVSR